MLRLLADCLALGALLAAWSSLRDARKVAGWYRGCYRHALARNAVLEEQVHREGSARSVVIPAGTRIEADAEAHTKQLRQNMEEAGRQLRTSLARMSNAKKYGPL